MRKLTVITLSGITLLGLSACGDLFEGSSPPPQQPIINNITPSGSDSGLTVLLTVAGMGAFLLLGAVILITVWGLNERRKRCDAETALETLTGKSITQLRMLVATPVSAHRLKALMLPVGKEET